MKDLFSLCLSQSYLDCWEDYQRSLKVNNFPKWDYVIITASNEKQADVFERQVESRKNYLPDSTKFVVIPDRDGKRVGSGGATLEILRYLKEKEDSFDNLCVLVIHSGGDSKRVPQYSALGKLFSPVPHELPDGRNATLFDEYIISMSSVPSRVHKGMVLLSGDILLLFNPLQIDYSGKGAAAISFKEPVGTGVNHGVYLNGANGEVKCCLQKKSEDILRSVGAVNPQGCVDIDTGALIFSTEMMESLYSLVETEELYNAHVNDKTRLSLYADFLYPLASDSTLEQYYLEKPEGSFCPELTDAREKVWKALRPYRMKLMRLTPSKFLHFGTSHEVLRLMNEDVKQYANLGWDQSTGSIVCENMAGYSSVLKQGATVGENVYLEYSYVHDGAVVGNNVILSYVEIGNEVIPDNVVVHALKQTNGKYVCRIFGINDNPKDNILFGKNLSDTGLSDFSDLWTAEIYPECGSLKEAVSASLNLYNIVINNNGDVEAWKGAARKSLYTSFMDADIQSVTDWSAKMEELVFIERLSNYIDEGKPVFEVKKLLRNKKISGVAHEHLMEYIDGLSVSSLKDFSKAIRLFWYLGTIFEDAGYMAECYKFLSKSVQKANLVVLDTGCGRKIVKDNVSVKLPLRVNWGGTWTDTPPYCLENGGAVLNAAISLNGVLPVEVTINRIKDLKIIFDSRDMDVHGEFDSIESLRNIGDPFDSFALQKACLLACGIIPEKGGNLCDILIGLGGGFEIHSEVTNVPKGSGLGTSSILASACVNAIFEFTGMSYTDDDIYKLVLAIEQMMSTGGGWQDQVGGFQNGIKYISSNPGLSQTVNVENILLSESARKEFEERFCLIYTGQRRLARNLLRDVIGRYIGNEPECINAYREIRIVAEKMKIALENNDIDEFAKQLDLQWKYTKKLERGTTNPLIDKIISSVEDLVDGKLVSGACGGGFIQIVMKKGISKEILQQRLLENFGEFDVDVWDCQLI